MLRQSVKAQHDENEVHVCGGRFLSFLDEFCYSKLLVRWREVGMFAV